MEDEPAYCSEGHWLEFENAQPTSSLKLFNLCSSVDHARECDVCLASIPSNQACFICHECMVYRCTKCGPGSVIEPSFDYVDHATGEKHSAPLDPTAVHGQQAPAKTRGLATSIDPQAKALATSIVDRLRTLADSVAQEPKDILDCHWEGAGADEGLTTLEWLLFDSTDIASDIMVLNAAVADLSLAGPTINEAAVPCRIFGDLHGQLRDLALLVHDFGMPGDGKAHTVFNGDWVDRGAHQVEVVCCVFALKIAFPDRVWLDRGNHEGASQNVHMAAAGFQQAVLSAFGEDEGPEVFQSYQNTFDALPLAALVGGRILCVHGGLGDGDWLLDDLREVERPLTDEQLPQNPLAYNVLWSDPIPDEQEDSFGVHDSPRDGHRGLVHSFGPDITEAFCEANGLDLIVRSHQEIKRGCGYEVFHNNRLVRVFSARDYEGNGNDGCVLLATYPEGCKDTSSAPITVRPQVVKASTKA